MSLSCQLQCEHKALVGATLSPVCPASSGVFVCLAPAVSPPPISWVLGSRNHSTFFRKSWKSGWSQQ